MDAIFQIDKMKGLLMRIFGRLKEPLIKYKPALAAVGLWVWLLAAAVTLTTSLSLIALGDKALLGWLLLVATLGSLIFLLRKRRRVLHFFAVLLLFTLIAALAGVLGHRYLYISEDGSTALGLVIFFSLSALYLFAKSTRRWGKVLSTILFVLVIGLNLLIVVMPNVWISDIIVSAVVGILTIGIGIFLVVRKNLFARFSGVGVILLVILSSMLSTLISMQLTEVVGENKETILGKTASQVENLLLGWNEKNYQQFSADFSDELKEKISEAAFVELRQSWGNYITKNEPRVGVQIYTKLVIYTAEFSNQPQAQLVFQFAESVADRWKIIGMDVTPL